MLRQLGELETILQQLIAEHRRLLAHVDAQQSAMRRLDLGAMDEAINGQEASRLRIATLETKRRGLVLMLTRGHTSVAGRPGQTSVASRVSREEESRRTPSSRDTQLATRDPLPPSSRDTQLATRDGRVTLTQIASLYPQRREPLLKLGTELKQLASQIASRSRIAGRLAGAVLGHLNTVVRLLAGAVDKRANVYTKDGVPRVASRIGIMEAVA